jgi:hypothetical protein
MLNTYSNPDPHGANDKENVLIIVADPEISKRGGGCFRKGDHSRNSFKKSRIFGLKSWVLLTLDGNFRTKGGVSL